MKKFQRLAIVTFQDPRFINGGIQRRVAAEVEYFSKRGIYVDVLTGGTGNQEIVGNVRFITFPTPQILYPFQILLFARKVANYLTKYQDLGVVELHGDSSIALLFIHPFKKSPKGVFIHVTHGVLRNEFFSILRYKGISVATIRAMGYLAISWAEQLAAHKATAIISVSNYVAKEISFQYRLPEKKFHIIPNGIDPDFFFSSRSIAESDVDINLPTCNLLFVGRLHIHKGVTQLLEGFSISRKINPLLRLSIVGDGPLKLELAKKCKELGIAKDVEFYGFLHGNDLIQKYRSANIVCIPSLQEGQGIVALEAQACGKPVIASSAGGLNEVVKDQITGLLVPPGNVEFLAQAIVLLSKSSTLQSKMGRSAAKLARSFSWDKLLYKNVQLYENLLAK